MIGEVSLADVLQPVPEVDSMYLLASGPPPPNPSSCFGRRPQPNCSRVSARHFDTVLVDSPPVLPVTDAAVLMPRADGTILVAKAGVTSRRAIVRAAAILDQVDGDVVGTVLNEITPATDGSHQAPGYGAHQSVNNEPAN